MRRTVMSSLTIVAIAAMMLKSASAQEKEIATKETTQVSAGEKTTSTTDKEVANAGAAKSSAKTIIPIFTLGGAITESPQGDDPFFGNVGTESFKDLIKRLEKARDDDDVQAIILFREGASLGRGPGRRIPQRHEPDSQVRQASLTATSIA